MPADVRSRVLALTRTTPPVETGLSHWSTRTMADYVTRTGTTPVSHHWVANLWREHGLKPQKQGTFKLSKDPRTAADAQIRAVDEPVPAGWYRYIGRHWTAVVYRPGAAVLSGRRDEQWIPADPTGEWFMLRTDTGERTRLTGTDEQAKGAGNDVIQSPERLTGRCGAFYPDSGDLCTAAGNWQQPSATFVAELPRAPRRLYDRLRADTKDHGQDPDQEVLVYAADALRSGLLPADLRAALYRALTYLPTLEITERTATLDGHTGTALGITAAGEQQEIVIDPATGAFIGERQRLTEEQDGIPAGTTIGSSTVRYNVVKKPWEHRAN
jgi:hypothetical protein